jgi:hypothetical protein
LTQKIRSSGRSGLSRQITQPTTQRRQAELVARGVDRLDPRQAEIPLQVGRAERRQEAAAGAVDVDGDVQPLILLEFVERVADGLDRLVLAGEGDAQGRHHADGVLVAALEASSGVMIRRSCSIGISRSSTSQ